MVHHVLSSRPKPTPFECSPCSETLLSYLVVSSAPTRWAICCPLLPAEEDMSEDAPELYRDRQYYRLDDHLKEASLQGPKVNIDILWTSMDGVIMIKDLSCDAVDSKECLTPGSPVSSLDVRSRSPIFASAAVFDRTARESTRYGDCLLRLVLNRRRAGLGLYCLTRSRSHNSARPL